jgi:predicted ArsR family transcriptional regulator
MTASSRSPGLPDAMPPDDLNGRIGVLTRREVEARILKPVIEALGARFGREQVVAVVRQTIIELAQTQGAELARLMDGSSAAHFLDSLDFWTQDDALEIELLEHDETHLSFNVHRCRYAEMYRALGMAELGAALSCNRDFALIDGFNPDATLERTQTIMQGASHCDFRYNFSRPRQPGAVADDSSNP